MGRNGILQMEVSIFTWVKRGKTDMSMQYYYALDISIY
jgi:hypothetical protein